MSFEDGIESTLMKFVDNTKLEGVASTVEDGTRIQNDVARLEK